MQNLSMTALIRQIRYMPMVILMKHCKFCKTLGLMALNSPLMTMILMIWAGFLFGDYSDFNRPTKPYRSPKMGDDITKIPQQRL